MKKWLIILLVVALPVVVCAEDEGAPVIDPADSGAPVVESSGDQRDQEPARDGEPAKHGDAAGKVPPPQGDKDEKSGVRFQSIEDLNKLGK
jgi:hypothetical protein